MAAPAWSRPNEMKPSLTRAISLANTEISPPAPYNCQPLSTRGYNQLAILGGPKASGLWFAMPDNLYNCEVGELNSICGHYREWGGTPNDPDIKLGAAISIDVATHRQVCAVN